MAKKDDKKVKNSGSILMGRIMGSIFKDIDKATNEHEVQAIYEKGLEGSFDVKIKHPHKCDGYIECDIKDTETGAIARLMLITEYKYDVDFMVGLDKSKVLVQVLFYLKRFENNGDDLPNVILVGDKDEVFVMHSNPLKPYLDWDIDWGIAPSSAAEKNMKLVLDIRDNEAINPYVYTIDNSFNFKAVCDEIRHLTFDVKSDIRITDNNMSKAFDYFCDNVLKDKKKLQANEIVHIFMDLMLNPRDAYIHPKKKNILVLSDKTEVAVNRAVFDSFFNHYTRENYSMSEKERLTEVADRLIEDTERRRKGEFYTPTIWVNEAHKMITEQFGETWRDEFVVWDCAWGTGNLTRDYKFKELYCSTLNEGDLEIGKKYNVHGTAFNRNGAKFQYDFLNDDVEFFEELKKVKEDKGYLEEKDFEGSKLYSIAPGLIKSLLEGKKLMFLINPPYATSGNIKSKNTTTEQKKGGVGATEINKIMKQNNMGMSSQQLYAQFVYRILRMKKVGFNVSLCLFSKVSILTSVHYKVFREELFSCLKYKSGFLFNAKEFADTSDKWGVLYTVWGDSDNNSRLDFFNVDIKINEEGTIKVNTTKKLYNMDSNGTCSKWVRELLSTLDKSKDTIYMKSALNSYHKDGYVSKVEGNIGSLFSNGNSVEKNSQFVAIGSSMFGDCACINIHSLNLSRVLSVFTARRLISGKYANWVNDKDEYMIPNIEHELYKQWESDCIVYSLFNSASNQSSLRQIDYKDKKWDIKNEFFFMSVEDIKALADVHCNDDVYQDIKEHGEERYVYKLLQEVELSEDAQAVLDKAIELTKESFKYRDMFNEDHPEYHINTWDAGWYQLKGVLKEYMPDELKEFNEMYKALGDRMRPLVYELGFLKK